MDKLSYTEVKALQRFAKFHGRYWKAALHAAWRRACADLPETCDGIEYRATLQRLRNAPYFGPAGLTKYRLPDFSDRMAESLVRQHAEKTAEKTPAPVVFQLTYGTSKIVGYDRGEWSWKRYEDYTPTDKKRAVRETVFCAGPKDVSPRHNGSTYGSGAGYDERCGWCYLGSCHTDDEHARRVDEAIRAAKQAEVR